VFSQRAIYDERYLAGGYDRRSAVHVLTAEMAALHSGVLRLFTGNAGMAEVSLTDFGYGTGRVTNDFILDYSHTYSKYQKNLRVIAYDISSIGLQKAAQTLRTEHGFKSSREFEWTPDSPHGYEAGSLERTDGDIKITVAFVHGCEDESPAAMRKLLIEVNLGRPSLITTSWYSGLGHVAGRAARDAFFAELGRLTDPGGEMLIAVASTGDVIDEQQERAERFANGDTAGSLIEGPGDVLYETELGKLNYWHVFGTDLAEHMQRITTPDQRWWIEGIRFPGNEFENREQELENYTMVRTFNELKRGKPWTAADFEKLHTVVALRSRRLNT
jgi:hypothetical protein